jgi:Tol biopolymer transport system component
MRAVLGAAVVALILAVAHAAPAASTATSVIVFSALPNGIGPTQLFHVDTTGAGLEQITTGSKPATAPAFSPDGTQIVFARLGSGIFRVNLDGTGLHRLTSGTRDSYPVMSPDGKHIAFIRPYRAQWRIYVMPASGGRQRRLPHAPSAGRPSWTANGTSIIIPARGSLARIDPRTGNVQKFYAVTLDPTVGQGATVSPDGRNVAFVGSRPRTGPPACGASRCEAYGLYLGSVSASHPKRIVNDTGPAGWSPDGKTLVYVSRGALTLDAIGSGRTTTVASGTNVASGDAPPAWQPR